MSWQALEWATRQEAPSSSAKLVLILLANRADEAHSCYPSVERLMDESQLGESTVSGCIAKLRQAGLLRVLRRGGAGRRGGGGGRRSNRYQLLVEGPDQPYPQADDWTSEYAPEAGAEAVSTGEAPDAGGLQAGSCKPLESGGLQAGEPPPTGQPVEGKPPDPGGANLQILEVPIRGRTISREPSSSSGHARAAAAIAAVTDADDDEAHRLAARLIDEHRPRSPSGYIRRMAEARPHPRGPSDLDLALAELRAHAPRAGPPTQARCTAHPQQLAAHCGPCRSEALAAPDEARAAPRRRWSPAPAT